MYSTIVLLSFLVFLSTCFILWKRRQLYYASYKLNGPFCLLPGIGNLWHYRTGDHLKKFMKDREKYGSPFRLWLGPKLFVYTSNPEDFEIVLNNPYALNKQEIYAFFKPVVREGLFSCSDVSRWRQDRKVIARMFKQRILNSYVPTFQENSKILSENLRKMAGKGSFDVLSLISFCHMDIICETVTGVKVNAQRTESECMKCLDRICEIIYSRILNVFLHPDFIFKRSTLGKEQKKLYDYVNNYNKNMIYSKRAQHTQLPQEEHYKESNVLLDYLITTGQFTDYELDAEFLTIAVGGIDTVATTEGFILMMLGMHPDLQDKAFEEQQLIFGDTEREITSADLSEMKYLERVIKETIRLFPVTGVIFRTITSDIQLRAYTLPKGATIALGILDAHRNENLWENPTKFDPDRFLPERFAEKHTYSYLPFSAGSRDCIGQRYGVMAMKVVLSTIIRKYKFHCEYKSVEDIKIQQHFTLRPKDGFNISLELRN